jgi:WD40 repeat protein
MELVPGVTITTYCDDHRLTPRQRLELFVPVCQAVQHAHQKGIIHRDLKPSNVLVALYDDRPVVKVIDFGVAKATGQPLTEQTLHTGLGAVVGTLEYMSPEQVGLNPLDIDTRSDIYSLGVLLYELMTGSPPFSRKELEKTDLLEMLRVIREQEPTRPSTKLSTEEGLPTLAANRGTEPKRLTALVRGELDWIVMKALEKDRNRRYETANGFAADVQRYLNDEHVLACPPSLGYRLRKFARRNKRALAVAVLVGCVLVLAGVLAVGIPLNAELRHQRDVAVANQDRAERAERENKIRAHLAKATAYRRSGQPGQRFKCLAEIAQALKLDPSPELLVELRTEAAAALVLPDVEVASEWEGWTEDGVSVGFDAAFQRYARLDDRGGVTICRVSGGREEVVTRLPAHGKPLQGSVGMSPDGRFVVHGHSWVRVGVFGGVRVWKLGPAPEVLLDEPAGTSEAALDFHRNGRQLAIGHADGSVSVYDLAIGRRTQRLAVGAQPVHLAFHPREPRLAVAAGGAVRLFDTDSGRELPALRVPGGTWVHSVAWHPDGRRLAAGCNDCKIHVWDAETTAEVMPPWADPVVGDGMLVRFNHAGDRLVSADWAGQTGLWDAGSGRLLLAVPDGNVGREFGPDDGVLGAGRSGNKIQLRRLANGRELRHIRGRSAGEAERIRSPVVHAAGHTLAVGTEHGLAFFDIGTGDQLAAVRLPHAATPVYFDQPRLRLSPEKAAGGEGAGDWVTGGRNGLFLWPARPDPARPDVLCVGPPRQLAPGVGAVVADGTVASADGRVVAVPHFDSTVVLHRDRADRRVSLGPQFDVRYAAVSPDGRWVVTCSHWHVGRSTSARVWDSETGQPIHNLPLDGITHAAFSPDGRWLVTRTSGTAESSCHLWEVGTWREVRRFDYAVETETGREVARLTGPGPTGDLPACFTPDGTRLIAASPGSLSVWDLRLIRQQLKELGLDWDWPDFPPAGPASRAPLRVEVRTGDVARVTLTPEQKARQAIDRYSGEVQANPDSARACNNLAWAYLTAPGSLRDVKAALPLAEKAVRLEPKSAVYRNTLGAAYYRAGRCRDAVETLRPNLESQKDADLAFDLYFLAMSYHQLGEPVRARDYYDWAVRWTKAQPSLSEGHLEELRRFGAEAAEVLEINNRKD